MTLLILLILIVILFTLLVAVLFAAVLDRYREVIKTTALDIVQIYAASNTARLDVKTRESELELTTKAERDKLETQVTLGRLSIHRQRQRLSGSIPGEHSE